MEHKVDLRRWQISFFLGDSWSDEALGGTFMRISNLKRPRVSVRDAVLLIEELLLRPRTIQAQEAAQMTLSVPQDQHQTPDTMYWRWTTSCIFTAKSIYNVLASQEK
jgi:hypothetical protein